MSINFYTIGFIAVVVGGPLLALFVYREKIFTVLAFGLSAIFLFILIGDKAKAFGQSKLFPTFIILLVFVMFGLGLYFTLREEAEAKVRREEEYKESDEYKLQEMLQTVRKGISEIDERSEKERQRMAAEDKSFYEDDS